MSVGLFLIALIVLGVILYLAWNQLNKATEPKSTGEFYDGEDAPWP